MNFNLTAEQWEQIHKWKSQIPKPKSDNPGGAIGGRFTYEFTPTNLGMVIKVKDNIGGWVLDLTNYEHW